MDSFKHSVSVAGAGQETFEQCWYACYKTLLKPSGADATLDTKLRGLLKTDVLGNDRLDDALKRGLLDTDYNTCSVALGLQSWAGGKFNQPASFFDMGLTDGAEAFLAELKKRPLWVSRLATNADATTKGYHIVIATGYDDTGKGYIIYNNPFPGPKDAKEVTTVPANTFVKFITNARGSVQGVVVKT